jgi:hypothetical protein
VNHRRHRGLDPADALLASFPRSGNTWLLFMLAELLTGDEVDFMEAITAVPLVGRHRGAPALLPGGGRLIKTHEAYRRTPVRRAVYLVRDVRDVVPSYHRLGAANGLPSLPFDTFVTRFADGTAGAVGRWQDHVAAWLDAAQDGTDVLLVRYERMVDDTAGELRRVVDHLRLDVPDDALQRVVANNSAARMRGRRGPLPADLVASSVATATYGGWQQAYTPAQLTGLGPTVPVMRRLGYDVGGMGGEAPTAAKTAESARR